MKREGRACRVRSLQWHRSSFRGRREGRACRVRSLQWHRSPFRGRRVGARWTRAASARGGGAKIREGSFSRSAINHAETLRTQRNPGLHHVANPSTCPVAASCDPPVGGVPCNFTFQRRAFGTYECRFDLQNNAPADCKGKSTVPVPKQNIVLYDPYHHMYGFPGINLLSRHMK